MGLLKSIFSSMFSSGNSSRDFETREHHGYAQYRDKSGKWNYTHRRAAEKKFGGKIWDGFVVHHRDGNKKNNRSSNLFVMSRKKHSSLHAKKRKKSFDWF
jgi:hypothetical protein